MRLETKITLKTNKDIEIKKLAARYEQPVFVTITR